MSPIYKYKTILSYLQIRAWNLHVVNPYKCVGSAVCGCLLTSSPVPTRIKKPVLSFTLSGKHFLYRNINTDDSNRYQNIQAFT